MTLRSIQIHPSALEETEAAAEWYMQRSPRAAEAFVDELGRVIKDISEYPARFPNFDLRTRRAALRKFPYLIVYRESDLSIQIVAVAHARRRPDYWRNRF